MKLLAGWTYAAAALSVGACTASIEPGASPAPAAASATLRDASGAAKVQATATQIGDSVRINVIAVDMAPGAYGAHVHAIGRCDAPDFTSAGPHWNPSGHEHGKDNPRGMHKGDLPNLVIGSDRRGSLEYTIPGASLRTGPVPILDGDGASLIVHAAADDYRTDPSGNSGARVACGLLG